jgi:ABC-type dipeptide/oligopeptide/nickel transport system permease subunit
MWRHVAPQTFAPLLILVTAAFGIAIIVESSLSFLGLGTPPPNPAWGSMLSGPTLQNVERAPWNAVFPGLVLTLVVFGFNLVGDSLRDILDPRLRR